MPAAKRQLVKRTRPAAPRTSSALVDIIVMLADANHTYFNDAFPRLVALACPRLADLAYRGYLRTRPVFVRSPPTRDPGGRRLAEIEAAYDDYMKWNANTFDVIGVTVTAPRLLAGLDPFYTFYDRVLMDHHLHITYLKLDLNMPLNSTCIRAFLDSVKYCVEVVQLDMDASRLRPDTDLNYHAEGVIKYMYNLQHLSFAGFAHHYVAAAHVHNSNLLLYNLPSSLVSLRLAGFVGFPLAARNATALRDMFTRDNLTNLAHVDLSNYRHTEGVADLAHANSRVTRVLLPERKRCGDDVIVPLLAQGRFLLDRSSRHALTVVAPRPDADRFFAAVDKHRLPNVVIEWYGM